MDELIIGGKTYLSSKRAAKVTGYAKDYVGQLCREGRVEAKLVGRSWYVYEPSIQEHRFNDERSKNKGKHAESDEKKEERTDEQTSENTNIQAVWQQPSYTSEPVESIPTFTALVEREPSAPAPENPQMLTDMQSAWQEWFSEHSEPKKSAGSAAVSLPSNEVMSAEEEKASHEPVYEPIVPLTRGESVPVRTIVSDIAPKREEIPVYRSEVRVRTRHAPKKATVGSPLIARALLIALIVFSATIMLIATGLIENLHIATLENSPVFQFFQGSTVLNK